MEHILFLWDVSTGESCSESVVDGFVITENHQDRIRFEVAFRNWRIEITWESYHADWGCSESVEQYRKNFEYIA